jgi:hypothetical protein
MRVPDSPWRALQVLTRIFAMASERARRGKLSRTQNLAMASEILAMARSAGQNLHNFRKLSNHSFYVRMQLGFHEDV